MYNNAVSFASTFASTASNYVSSGASSTLSTLSMSVSNSTAQWPGGSGFFQLGGTMSGGTVSLGYVDAIGNNVSLVSVSAPGSATFALPRAVVYISSNAGTSAGRTVAIQAALLPSNLI